jgi:hypothetical protein
VGDYYLIATHLDQSNHLPNQKQGAAVNKCNLTVFIWLFQGSSRALKVVYFFRVPAVFTGLDWWNLIKGFQCRVTDWVLVEMLLDHLHPQNSNKHLLYFRIKLVWPVLLAQVLPRPQLIFPSKTWFFGNLFEFSVAEIHLKINISHTLNPNLTK